MTVYRKSGFIDLDFLLLTGQASASALFVRSFSHKSSAPSRHYNAGLSIGKPKDVAQTLVERSTVVLQMLNESVVLEVQGLGAWWIA
jgi:hypothetical protein